MRLVKPIFYLDFNKVLLVCGLKHKLYSKKFEIYRSEFSQCLMYLTSKKMYVVKVNI